MKFLFVIKYKTKNGGRRRRSNVRAIILFFGITMMIIPSLWMILKSTSSSFSTTIPSEELLLYFLPTTLSSSSSSTTNASSLTVMEKELEENFNIAPHLIHQYGRYHHHDHHHPMKIHKGGVNIINTTYLCVDWNTNMDEWWTHHPSWEVVYENDDMFCFSIISNTKKRKFYEDLYQINYGPNGNCSNVWTQHSSSSGWGSDISYHLYGLVESYKLYGLVESYKLRRPMTATEWNWKFARGVCHRNNIFCYFLNVSHCPPNGNDVSRKRFFPNQIKGDDMMTLWAYDYLKRPQQWVRWKVYNITQQVQLEQPCVAFHIRRTDVILHGVQSRKYYQVSEYVDVARAGIPPPFDRRKSIFGHPPKFIYTPIYNLSNIMLLTDDQDAIEEAEHDFPQYNWRYLDRTRYRGCEGGWEGNIPSGDPSIEIINLLASFRLVRECGRVIKANGGLAHYLGLEVLFAKNNNGTAIDIDRNVPKNWQKGIQNVLTARNLSVACKRQNRYQEGLKLALENARKYDPSFVVPE